MFWFVTKLVTNLTFKKKKIMTFIFKPFCYYFEILEMKKKRVYFILFNCFNFWGNSILYAFYTKQWLCDTSESVFSDTSERDSQNSDVLSFFFFFSTLVVVAYTLPMQLSKALQIKVFPKTHYLAKPAPWEINVHICSLSEWLVLERKISMRKPREELIERGLLKDIPENGMAN